MLLLLLKLRNVWLFEIQLFKIPVVRIMMILFYCVDEMKIVRKTTI